MSIENMITAQPAEIIPVSDHVFHIVPSRFAFAEPYMLLVPEGLAEVIVPMAPSITCL